MSRGHPQGPMAVGILSAAAPASSVSGVCGCVVLPKCDPELGVPLLRPAIGMKILHCW